MTDLGTLGGNSSGGSGINSRGQVTGGADTISGDGHAFLYNHGTMTDLGTLPGGNYSEGYGGINNRGQVTGISNTSSGDYHAYLYDHGTMYGLNNLVTNLDSAGFVSLDEGFNINNHGQIVGDGTTMNGNLLAYLATPDPPTPSVPLQPQRS
ncbi:MAG: hypothetical protein ACU4EQ_08395 [Candidatus Nitrosoglobus sp.]|jgi:probable HAF family extracellular repeat protein